MSGPLATLEALADRLEWTLSDDEQRLAVGALAELSDDARFYGKASWTSASTTPTLVRNLVLKAAARFMRNPDGFVQSRAGDEAVAWGDRGPEAGAAHFTDREIKMLRTIAGTPNMLSTPISAWESTYGDETGYAPVEGGGKVFPIFASDVDAI